MMDRLGRRLKGGLPRPTVALLLVAVLLLAMAAPAVLTAPDSEPVRAVVQPEVRAAPDLVRIARPPTRSENGKVRIGGFDRPDWVPGYEVLSEEPAPNRDVRATRLLVDTGIGNAAGLELITRDIKARYAGHDAVSVEFIDFDESFDQQGAALIFNTPAGVDFMGYFYGPPSTDGYYVRMVR